MSDLIPWVRLEYLSDLCPYGKRVIAKLGGEGITLSQAHKACKNKVFNLPFAVRAATALKLDNWKLALGKVVAHVHPKAKDYYENEFIYFHNQEALENGRLENVDKDAAKAAYAGGWIFWYAADTVAKAARAAGMAFWAVGRAVGWVEVTATERAAWATERTAEAASHAAGWAVKAVGNVAALIGIYFDVLKD